MAEVRKKKSLWNFIDSLEGDKVVWMVAILLILTSIVAIFSSTSQLALKEKTTRIDIIREQVVLAAVGLGVIIICCRIKRIYIFRFFSQFAFIISLILLLILDLDLHIGPIEATVLNDAKRILNIGPYQLNVSEFVKVAMVMYMAWAVNALKNNDFWLINKFAGKYPVLKKQIVKETIYIFIPLVSTCVLLMPGGMSSPVFIGGIMFLTILIGGVPFKHIIEAGVVALLVLGCCILINQCFEEGHKPFPHIDSSLNRFGGKETETYYLDIMRNSPRNSKEFQNAIGKIKQPISAEIAIHEGGFFGKGPGGSTQRYVVSIMFEDFMYSFIVEEYGLLGGVFILILYISLLARGAIIVRNCENLFAKTAVAGLVLLISGQAMMHIMVNARLGPMTGQTLPLISHGAFSFLMFSTAFGIILSISKMAQKKIEREAQESSLVNMGAKSNAGNEPESASSLDTNADEEETTVHENDIPDYGIDDHNNE